MTKNLLSLAFFMLVLFHAHAQVPNGNFEEWTTFDDFENPDGWITSNLYHQLSPLVPVSATKVEGVSGSALKLTTTAGPLNQKIPGFAFNANSLENIGFPFSSRPTLFEGSFKYEITDTDSALIILSLSRWNPEIQDRDSIGGAFFWTNVPQTTYKPFTASVFYTSLGGNPDTATVLLFAGVGKNARVGSALTVDELSISGVTGVKYALLNDYSKAFPNPSKDFIRITNIPNQAASIEVNDLTGRTIYTAPVSGNFNLNVSEYKEGLYHYTIKNSSDAILYHEKISVVK